MGWDGQELGLGARGVAAPTPNGVSDVQAMQAALNAANAAGLPLDLYGGTYVFTAIGGGLVVPSRQLIRCFAPTTFLGHLDPSGAYSATNVLLWCPSTYTAGATTNAAVVASSKHFGSTTLIPDNTWVFLTTADTFWVWQRKVLSHTGAGPYVYTMDEPITENLATAAPVNVIVQQPHDITIEGNNMLTLTGTGAAYMLLYRGRNVKMLDVRLDTTGGTPTGGLCLADFDQGSRDCEFSGTTSGGQGFSMFSAEHCAIKGSKIYEIQDGGDYVQPQIDDCFACTIDHTLFAGSNRGGSFGIEIGGQGGDGSYACAIRDSQFYGHETGILLSTCGSITMDGLDIAATVVGMTVAFGNEFSLGNSRIRLTSAASTVIGIQVSTACKFQVVGNTLITYTEPGAADAIQIRAVYAHAAAAITFKGLHVNWGAAGSALFVTFYLDATGMVVLLDDVLVDGSNVAASYDLVSSTGTATVRYGNNVNLGATTNHIYGSLQLSRGTVQANGTSPVDVAFSDLKASDRVVLSPVHAGRNPQITYTPGTKFTINALSGDTDIYPFAVI